MESSKLSALLLILVLSVSSTPVTLACGNSCPTPSGTPESPGITVPGIVGGIVGKVPGVVGNVPGVVGGVVGNVPGVAGGVVGTVGGVVGGVVGTVGGVVGAVPGVVGAVPGVVGKVPGIVVGTVPGVVGAVPGIVGGIIGKVPGIAVGGGAPKSGGGSSCPSTSPHPPPPSSPTLTPLAAKDECPVDVLKLGASLENLGQGVGIGESASKFCPLIEGLDYVSAVACICRSIKAKALNIAMYGPFAAQLLGACGKSNFLICPP